MTRALLGGLSPVAFLRRHWQKRPLLVRGAFPRFRDPVTPKRLLALSLKGEVDSRLVLTGGGRRTFEVWHGPQHPKRLRRLQAANGTLLVENVDRHVRGVRALQSAFDFIPRWRFDDVMVSFATPGGGVGPHIDSYDVFLIQGRGRRRWSIDSRAQPVHRSGLDLKVLRSFRPELSWVLEPGDMLYVPPGLSHEGVALEEALTYSVGFRAPSHRALVAAFAERLLASTPEDRLYGDPDLQPAAARGDIEPKALVRMRRIIRAEIDRALRLDLADDLRKLLGVRRS